jgi:membrane associated rhomboid family serine protease
MRIPKRQLQPSTRSWAVAHPPAWAILIAINAAFFTAQQILLHFNQQDALVSGLGLTDAGIKQGYFWEFLTCTFLHGGWVHLLANMFFLYFAGREVEALLGVRHFLAIYFGGGILGSVAQWLITPLPVNGPLIGASACVLAALIAFTTILPELEITCLLFFVIPIRLKAKHLARAVVGISLLALLIPYLVGHLPHVSGVAGIMALFGGGSYITAHYAHLGGCLFGWVYVKQLGYGNPLRIQRYFLEKRQKEERRKYMSSEQFINQEIDPILEKISRDGIRSLTRAEKRILEMGREKITRDRR